MTLMPQRWTTFFAAVVLVASLACGGSAEPDTKGASSEPDTKGTSSKSDSYELVPCEFEDEATKEELLLRDPYLEKLLLLTIELAEQGDPEAQLALALSLQLASSNYVDRTITFDQALFFVEANRFYRCAAEQGEAKAQSNLGLNAEYGVGMPLDYTEAYRWYRLAAEQGDRSAMHGLAGLYANGQGVLQDDLEAIRWYQSAAEQGSTLAQQQLGLFYNSGRGVPKDDVQAYMWFNIAVSRETGTARDAAVLDRDRIANLLTPDQRAEAQRLAREWGEAHPLEP